jgi:CheY-like chemotaxis protein
MKIKEPFMAQNVGKTVLVVDDEADVRNYLKAALVEAGFEVVTAEDGFEALEAVEKHPPDLISLDLVMPRKSGIKFYRDLAKNSRWSKIPIIIVTGHARDDLGKADLKELTMSGPGIYLEKPVKPDNYIAAIKKTLGMDTTREEKAAAEQVELQNELKNLIDDADPETLRKLKDKLKEAKD